MRSIKEVKGDFTRKGVANCQHRAYKITHYANFADLDLLEIAFWNA